MSNEAPRRAVECQCCGMLCDPGEYHPYAACLMFKACQNSQAVWSNLQAVQDYALATHRANYDALVIRLGDVTTRLEVWRTLVGEHNASRESACDMDRCGYRPYFENNGRRCSECPHFDTIDIPDYLQDADHV